MKRAWGHWLAVGALLWTLGVRAPARACEPIGIIPFTVTPSTNDMVGPTLPPIPPPVIERAEQSSPGDCGSNCRRAGSVSIAALATDDLTAHPGYRFTLIAGTLPGAFVLPSFPIQALGDRVVLFGAAGEDEGALDYTLQVVAVDAAGNESGTQTVRVYADQVGCAIAGWRVSRRDDFVKRISSKVANGVRSRLLRDETPDTGCGLKLFERALFLDLPYFDHMHRYLPALVQRAGYRTISVPVGHRPRTRGTSKYGVMNRLFVGISDLRGVAWLIRRGKRTATEEV